MEMLLKEHSELEKPLMLLMLRSSKAQYLYEDGDFHNFMGQNLEPCNGQYRTGSEKDYLTENLKIDLLLYKGNPVGVGTPNFIEDESEYCEPGVKGNTATGAVKPATLACGAKVNVPLFVEQGERIKVDTRTNEYVSRVK